jgi:hypothetical protein
MDELDLRIRNHAYGSFVRTGTTLTAREAAAELGLGAEESGTPTGVSTTRTPSCSGRARTRS